MSEPMKAAVFICRAHGANLIAYRGLMKHPRVGHSEMLPICCSEEGRNQIQLHLLGRTTQALLVLGCDLSELKKYQDLAALAGIPPTRVAVVPFQIRTAHAAELALAKVLDEREARFPTVAQSTALLLVGDGSSADAAYEQAAAEGLNVVRLAPADVEWNEARLTGGRGNFILEAGEVMHQFGLALLSFDLSVQVDRMCFGEGDTVVALAGGEECLHSFVSELESALSKGGKVYAVVQETPFSGDGEILYRDLQLRGVIFLRAPEIEVVGGSVTVNDEHLGCPLHIKAGDLVTVRSSRPELADVVLKALGMPSSRRTVGLVPGDSGLPGVFLCGSAFSAHHESDPAGMARATVASLIKIIRSPIPRIPLAAIDQERCSLCLTCLRVCPYGAPFLSEGEMSISAERCQGCGMCLALCPSVAIEMPPTDLRAETGTVKMGGGLK
ncbi:MAG: 4Fe-4S binding protein [Methanomassiliicoccales archaeon]